MLYRLFHFEKKIPINCSFTQWKWTKMKMKCTQDELYGRAAFKNARVRPCLGGPRFWFFRCCPYPHALTNATLVGGIKRDPLSPPKLEFKLVISIVMSWSLVAHTNKCGHAIRAHDFRVLAKFSKKPMTKIWIPYHGSVR